MNEFVIIKRYTQTLALRCLHQRPTSLGKLLPETGSTTNLPESKATDLQVFLTSRSIDHPSSLLLVIPPA